MLDEITHVSNLTSLIKVFFRSISCFCSPSPPSHCPPSKNSVEFSFNYRVGPDIRYLTRKKPDIRQSMPDNPIGYPASGKEKQIRPEPIFLTPAYFQSSTRILIRTANLVIAGEGHIAPVRIQQIEVATIHIFFIYIALGCLCVCLKPISFGTDGPI